MSATIVQFKNATGDATTTTLSATFDSAPTEGNRLFAYAASDATLSTTGLVGLGWSLVGSTVGDVGLYMWSKIAGASEPTTITVTPTTAAATNLRISEISGLDANPVDQTASNHSTLTAQTTISTGTTPATTDADEWVVALFGIGRHRQATSTVIAYSNSFVETAQVANTAGNHPLLATAAKTVSATGTQECTATLSLSEDHPCALIATFRLAPPITLSYRHSGGATNADPRASHGGAESSVHAGAALFDDIANAVVAGAGQTDYRCIYVHNESGSGDASMKVYVATQPPTSTLSVGAATEAPGTAVATTTDRFTAPSGVSFVEANDSASGVSLGTIGPGESKGIWIKRVVPSGASPAASDPWSIHVVVIPL